MKIALEFSMSVDWLLGLKRTKGIDVAGATDEQVTMLAGWWRSLGG